MDQARQFLERYAMKRRAVLETGGGMPEAARAVSSLFEVPKLRVICFQQSVRRDMRFWTTNILQLFHCIKRHVGVVEPYLKRREQKMENTLQLQMKRIQTNFKRPPTVGCRKLRLVFPTDVPFLLDHFCFLGSLNAEPKAANYGKQDVQTEN